MSTTVTIYPIEISYDKKKGHFRISKTKVFVDIEANTPNEADAIDRLEFTAAKDCGKISVQHVGSGKGVECRFQSFSVRIVYLHKFITYLRRKLYSKCGKLVVKDQREY